MGRYSRSRKLSRKQNAVVLGAIGLIFAGFYVYSSITTIADNLRIHLKSIDATELGPKGIKLSVGYEMENPNTRGSKGSGGISEASTNYDVYADGVYLGHGQTIGSVFIQPKSAIDVDSTFVGAGGVNSTFWDRYLRDGSLLIRISGTSSTGTDLCLTTCSPTCPPLQNCNLAFEFSQTIGPKYANITTNLDQESTFNLGNWVSGTTAVTGLVLSSGKAPIVEYNFTDSKNCDGKVLSTYVEPVGDLKGLHSQEFRPSSAGDYSLQTSFHDDTNFVYQSCTSFTVKS